MRHAGWLSLVGLLLLASCGGRKARQSSWDSATGTYTIPSLGISYTVPSDVRNWAIADIDGSVPPEIKFCGVDHSTDICIVIVEPDNAIKSVSALDEGKVRDILHEIIGQSPSGQILRFTPNLERVQYAGSKSWNFSVDLSIANPNDTAKASYTGYIFNCPDRKVAGIVAIVPAEVLDSIGKPELNKYFDGVSLITNH